MICLIITACYLCFVNLNAQENNQPPLETKSNLVYQLQIDGAIGPATSEYIKQGIEKAEKAGAQFVIIQIDTPGGLVTSMRKINLAILSSKIPIVTFVSPEGARAASAGTYILYASHVAAMAPATNLGAATPVNMGGFPGQKDQDKDKKSKENQNKDKNAKQESPSNLPSDAKERKALNDSLAYIRGLAEKRGRNAEWAEKAVRTGDSLTSQEALKLNVIDLIAFNQADLLAKLEGRAVKIGAPNQGVILSTTNIQVETLKPSWKNKFLNAISDPNLAYLLFLIGFYGLIYEFINPGFVVPGVIGAICLLLGFYALHVLPVNYVGIALILLGIALMVAEAFVPSFGALGIGGVAAFILGSLMLINTEDIPGIKISRSLIFSVALVSGAFCIGVISMAIRARRRQVVSGSQQILGAIGEAMEDFQETGNVFVDGEIWYAKSPEPLKKGDRVQVVDRDGLTLTVKPASSE